MLYGPAIWVSSFVHKHEDDPSPPNCSAKATGRHQDADKTSWRKVPVHGAKACVAVFMTQAGKARPDVEVGGEWSGRGGWAEWHVAGDRKSCARQPLLSEQQLWKARCFISIKLHQDPRRANCVRYRWSLHPRSSREACSSFVQTSGAPPDAQARQPSLPCPGPSRSKLLL